MGFSILCVLDEWGAPACEGFEGGDKENLRDELSLEICRSIFLTLFGLAKPLLLLLISIYVIDFSYV